MYNPTENLQWKPPANVTYMCNKRFVDGGLWVTAPALFRRLPLHDRAGQGRLPIKILEARTGPLFWSWMIKDGRHAKLHLEVQKIIPGVFEEQILPVRDKKMFYFILNYI